MLETLSAFIASAVGKTATGVALAAMSVGGMHAAGIVDLPGLPEHARAGEILDPVDDSGTADDGDVIIANSVDDDEGEAKSEDEDEMESDEESEDDEMESDDDSEESELDEGDGGPSEHALAMQEWASCVGEAASMRGVEMPEWDPTVDGPPGRFDPEEACGEKPSNHGSDDESEDDESEDDEQGPPEHAQSGKPDDVPHGPPADRPHGPPAHAGQKGGRP